MKDVMLDLETLGTRNDALIIQIGACYFDRYTGEIGQTFSANVMPNGTIDRFSVDYETIAWWFGQTNEARAKVMGSPEKMEVALLTLRNFLRMEPEVFIWSHATFDMPILQNAFNELQIHFPVPFRNARDIRTLMDFAEHSSATPREGTHHNALDDAKYQAQYVAEAMYKLKYGQV
jgi:DNA polymerase III epsilon subunit-like protein